MTHAPTLLLGEATVTDLFGTGGFALLLANCGGKLLAAANFLTGLLFPLPNCVPDGSSKDSAPLFMTDTKIEDTHGEDSIISFT